MAAPTGQRGSHTAEPTGFEGFPFTVAGKPPEERTGKEQDETGQVKKKPCRACTDFKSWMKVQKKESAGVTQVSVRASWLTLWSWILFLISCTTQEGKSAVFTNLISTISF